jgi:hypothetical protein
MSNVSINFINAKPKDPYPFAEFSSRISNVLRNDLQNYPVNDAAKTKIIVVF